MNRMTKRLVSILLALALVASLGVAAYAAETEKSGTNGTADVIGNDTVTYQAVGMQYPDVYVRYEWSRDLTWTYVKATANEPDTTISGAWFHGTVGDGEKTVAEFNAQRDGADASAEGGVTHIGVGLTVTNLNDRAVYFKVEQTNNSTDAITEGENILAFYSNANTVLDADGGRSIPNATAAANGGTYTAYVRPLVDGTHKIATSNLTTAYTKNLKITFKSSAFEA